MPRDFTRDEIEIQLKTLDQSTKPAAIVDAMIIRQLLAETARIPRVAAA